jgi:hypothetical protein
MSIRDELRKATGAELSARLARGHALEAGAIAGWVYRGTSLGLPSWVEALSWVSFQKVFMRDDASGRVMGWNVRLEQTGLHGPSQPKRDRRGEPVRFGAYEVYPMKGARAPRPVPEGALLIDYSRAKAHALDPLAFIVDPLVALEPGNAEMLLGWSYVALGGGIPTPSYFLLEREKPLDHAPPEAVRRALAQPARAPAQTSAA